MQLSTRYLPRWQQLRPTTNLVAWIVYGSLIATLEFVVGNMALRDLHDFLAAMVLMLGTATFAMRNKKYTKAEWKRKGLRLLQFVDIFRYDRGFDLRGSPAYPARLPPMMWVLWLLSACWFTFAASSWWVFPNGWRDLGQHTSYILYLVFFSLIWIALIASIFLSLWTTLFVVDEQLRLLTERRSMELFSIELFLLISYLMTLFLFANYLPVVMAPLCCLVIAFVSCLFMMRKPWPVPVFLWRFGPGRNIFSVTTSRMISALSGLFTLFAVCLVLTACGGHLWNRPEYDDPMLLTHLGGITAAWLMPCLFFVSALRIGATLRQDPANRTRLTVQVQISKAHFADAKLIRDCMAREQLDCELRLGPVRKRSVGIEIVTQEESQATEFRPTWPLKVSVQDLVEGSVFERIRRRDELTLRHRALLGVKVLFKKARHLRKKRSGGFLFAPQWWIVEGMQREESSGRSERKGPKMIKPTYHQLYEPRVRQHWHHLLRILQVDMIFIEDGVSTKTIVRVLRSMFEFYDKSAGLRRIENHLLPHFPRTRIEINDWEPSSPPTAERDDESSYDERQYEELYRARVMMVFRDDEGEKVDEPEPFDFSWEPSPGLGIY